jgi:hypothetical protein
MLWKSAFLIKKESEQYEVFAYLSASTRRNNEGILTIVPFDFLFKDTHFLKSYSRTP